ncbi:putative DNA (cytosine-5)-methyltransferase CMT1 [Malania oleifera]|uniref:putative DNA (cytosine-5)-methyltransferase CMT1 n=1 Tax=Malania oleifera TaxID=397392 RepID=UPI0025AE5234|nr:putative DNA (cytosine-5)-methyltransferase CMT1 [Malania oleifera]
MSKSAKRGSKEEDSAPSVPLRSSRRTRKSSSSSSSSFSNGEDRFAEEPVSTPPRSTENTRTKAQKESSDDEVVRCEGEPKKMPKSAKRGNKGEGSTPSMPLRSSKRTKKSSSLVGEGRFAEEPVPMSPCSTEISTKTNAKKESADEEDVRFEGEPMSMEEARAKWPKRYRSKNMVKKGVATLESIKDGSDEEEEVLQAKCHYTKAVVDGCCYNLNDDAYIKAEDGMPDYIGKIVELFETTDGEAYFTAQWFFRAEDTAIKEVHANLIDKRQVFYSDKTDDNPLDSIVSRVKIVQVDPNVGFSAKERIISSCDLYYNKKFSLPFLTFSSIFSDNSGISGDTSSTISSDDSSCSGVDGVSVEKGISSQVCRSKKSEMTLLDLYAGCGAMSTGLCLGACKAGLKLTTRWAVDINSYACQSLRFNHPETQVRNEAAEDFLSLLKEWLKLCQKFSLLGSEPSSIEMDNDEDSDEVSTVPPGEFEVGRLLDVCFGDPNNVQKRGLHFKVRWKGYGPSEDTWEPIEGLSKCMESLKDFVTRGYNSRILPLPGDVDFICGGPPCQGISGFNRFRNRENPLEDQKNHQLVVFMDIVNFLNPKYVLMENVVDILKFAEGFLGRYAMGRLVSMNYQVRMGMMAAGSYGLPQYRMRVFLWGAHPMGKLPQYPLPTHETIGRGVVPTEFEEIVVAHDKSKPCKLEKALTLADAFFDLPPITNHENQDEMPYGKTARTEFQKYIRLRKQDSLGGQNKCIKLYDHRPLQLNDDDYGRVCHIPKEKGANFRNLPGVKVNQNNRVEWDESIERVLLPSGKPLVPDYAMTFVDGRSTKPFARLWWDEIVATVVTRAEPHNQAILHPEQDRVLSVRENARLQGFPDYYKLDGPVKERYIQVGNAVAIPVALALGYSFGMAFQGMCDDEPLTMLPFKFPNCLDDQVETE